jgi:4-hydroxy-tetrahydrodipicolinate reductase
MGKRLVALCHADPDLELAAALEAPGHPDLNQDAGLVAGIGSTGVQLSDQCLAPLDAMIDFSTPVGTEQATQWARQRAIPLVVATTGMDARQTDLIREAAKTIPIVWAPSMSMAVNLCMKLAAVTGQSLHSSGVDADVEIIERHHRFKEDAPSGTALRFGEILAESMQLTHHQHGREGRTGVRPRHEIGYHAVRTGDNPGEHTLIFGMLGETIEITVRASNRDCYAAGALLAAKFVARQQAGLYDMFDVLGLNVAPT